MNWEAIGAIGEIIGAIAVVATLVYLSAQIRQSNREARASTLQAALRFEMEATGIVAQHGEIWDKVVTGKPLEKGGEMRTAIIIYNTVMTEAENRYHQFKAGYLDEQSWEGRYISLRRLADMPIYDIWKKSPGALNHSIDFLQLLDSIHAEPKD